MSKSNWLEKFSNFSIVTFSTYNKIEQWFHVNSCLIFIYTSHKDQNQLLKKMVKPNKEIFYQIYSARNINKSMSWFRKYVRLHFNVTFIINASDFVLGMFKVFKYEKKIKNKKICCCILSKASFAGIMES